MTYMLASLKSYIPPGESEDGSGPDDNKSVFLYRKKSLKGKSLERQISNFDYESEASNVISITQADDSSLVRVLNTLKQCNANIIRIKTRTFKRQPTGYDIFLNLSSSATCPDIPERYALDRTNSLSSSTNPRLQKREVTRLEMTKADSVGDILEAREDGEINPIKAPPTARSKKNNKAALEEMMAYLSKQVSDISLRVGAIGGRKGDGGSDEKLAEEKESGGNSSSDDKKSLCGSEEFAGFPLRITDIDLSAHRVLLYGTDLDADHPGFSDPEYRRRRVVFGELAMNYRHGTPLPWIEYTAKERHTWHTIFTKLTGLYPKYACKEYLENFDNLVHEGIYGADDLPQLNAVSGWLKKHTGFQLRPVAGYLSPRDFLAGLAFRVFHTTQYIRHDTQPFYTPEPDCCHELLGHVPMLADPSFAQFSQEIGLASLGASDEDVQKLATLYFFTIEFGLCKENGEMKVYGAGLLSCVAELEHVMTSPRAVIKWMDPKEVVETECMITTFQQCYFYTNTFEEAKEKLKVFADSIKKPFVVRYNPYTESIELVETTKQLTRIMGELQSDIAMVTTALARLQSSAPVETHSGSPTGSHIVSDIAPNTGTVGRSRTNSFKSHHPQPPPIIEEESSEDPPKQDDDDEKLIQV